jgi:hypothetical protein
MYRPVMFLSALLLSLAPSDSRSDAPTRHEESIRPAVTDHRPAPTVHESSLRFRGCVLCDECNGSASNHITAFGGQRKGGSAHPCFDGVACAPVHGFTQECGGVSDENTAASNERDTGSTDIPWAHIAQLTGNELGELLQEHPERWRFNASRRSLQYYDCFGSLIASIGVSDSQLQAVESALLALE